jgi:predicted RNA binding protein YcfA (HicA-like mRNA interferase family)
MPPRVRELVARLNADGFVLKRRGRGDHSVYQNPKTGAQVTIDGAPSHEVPKAVWEKLKKRFGWRDE